MTIRAMTTKIVALLEVAALGAFASSALAELVCGEAVSDGSSASRGGSWSRAVYEDETRSSDVERNQTMPQIKEAGCRASRCAKRRIFNPTGAFRCEDTLNSRRRR